MSKAVLLNDTSRENHIGCKLVIQNIKTLCKTYKICLLGTFDRDSINSSNRQLMSSIADSDFILVNGEGTLHHSPETTSRLLEFGNKPKVLINAVWEKMFFVDRALDNFRYISVRESMSYKEVVKYAPKGQVCIVPDLIFYNTESIKVHDTGFGDSVMPYVREKFKQRNNYFPLQVEATHPDLYAYISWMRTLKLYVTGRFHGVCLAMMLGIPFLAVPSNSHKIEGLLKDCGCLELLISNESEILEKRKRAQELIVQAHTYVNSAKAKIEHSFRAIANIANSFKKVR